MVVEAGGRISTTEGAPWYVDAGQILASNSIMHADIVKALAGA